MALRSRSESRLVRPWPGTAADGSSLGRRPARLASEEPMAIELDGVRVTTTMRTPGDDFELAAGFCLAEGLLEGNPITGVRYCATGSAVTSDFNVVSVSTDGKAPRPRPRLTTTTSSCGFCGSDEIGELLDDLEPVEGAVLDWALLAAAPAGLRAAQVLFGTTGAVHAAAVIAPDGSVGTVREDVGRHNAVDKIIGRRLFDSQLPATGLGLVVSGRASFELVHKAWAGGFRALVAVSAPTALAVGAAAAAGMQLAGFARDDRLTIYVDP